MRSSGSCVTPANQACCWSWKAEAPPTSRANASASARRTTRARESRARAIALATSCSGGFAASGSSPPEQPTRVAPARARTRQALGSGLDINGRTTVGQGGHVLHDAESDGLRGEPDPLEDGGSLGVVEEVLRDPVQAERRVD